jgi:hypothetical protein
MAQLKRPLLALATLAATALASALAGPGPVALAATPGSAEPGGSSGAGSYRRALLDSHELWATIDVCSPADQPYTVGVRGSMPGDGKAHDKMFMSFRLQYLDAATKQWVDLSGATPAFVAVGSGAAARQDGSSFQLVPGKTASTLRGVVDFQWRRGGTVLLSASRPTTAGRQSLAGADPAGFSAASCLIAAA